MGEANAHLSLYLLGAGRPPVLDEGEAGRRGVGLEPQAPGRAGEGVQYGCGQGDDRSAQHAGHFAPAHHALSGHVVDARESISETLFQKVDKVVLVKKLHRGIVATETDEQRLCERPRDEVLCVRHP